MDPAPSRPRRSIYRRLARAAGWLLAGVLAVTATLAAAVGGLLWFTLPASHEEAAIPA